MLQSWLKLKDVKLSATFASCFKRYVGSCEGPKAYGHLFMFIQKCCKPVMLCSRVGMIEGCCHLLNGLLGISDLTLTKDDVLSQELERLFIFSLTWSVGGLLDEDDRPKFTDYLGAISSGQKPSVTGFKTQTFKSSSGIMPQFTTEGDTLFEYRVNTDSMEWERWVAPAWEYPSMLEDQYLDFSSMLVPTLSHQHLRSTYLINAPFQCILSICFRNSPCK